MRRIPAENHGQNTIECMVTSPSFRALPWPKLRVAHSGSCYVDLHLRKRSLSDHTVYVKGILIKRRGIHVIEQRAIYRQLHMGFAPFLC